MVILFTKMYSADVPKWRGPILLLSQRLAASAAGTDALRNVKDYPSIKAEEIGRYLDSYTDEYDKSGTILLAIDGTDQGEPVLAGFAVVRSQPDWNTGEPGCIVERIAVGKRYEGKGIGRQLLGKAEQMGRDHGAKRLYIEHFVSNEHAAGVYDKYGLSPYVLTRAKRLDD